MKNMNDRQIVRIMDLTDIQADDLRDFGFTVVRIVNNLFEISVSSVNE